MNSEENKLTVRVLGSTHTFCNALRDELWNVKGVTVSTYSQSHPEIGIPKVFVETDGNITPKDALNTAVDALIEKNTDFLKQAKKAL